MDFKKYDLIVDSDDEMEQVIIRKNHFGFLNFKGAAANGLHNGYILKYSDDFLKHEYHIIENEEKKQDLIREYEMKMALSVNQPYCCRHCTGTRKSLSLLLDVDFLTDDEVENL